MIISTPAKIILSGEHSVVYGAPAIGAPLALFLRSEWVERADGKIVLHFRGTPREIAPSWGLLGDMLPPWRERYARFKAGELPIGAVLPEAHDLAALTFAVFRETSGAELPGLSLSIETDIPVSSGLGSSSALILNLLQGLSRLSGIELADILGVARGIENFQHGTSSGLDLALVSSRKPLVFVKGQGVIGTVPRIPDSFTLIHSGTPSVSTGQCVARVREAFAQDTVIWADFTVCTRNMQAAFEAADNDNLSACVRQNQALLERIGVVPEKVQSFIADCGARGIAAKVCGAGAVEGEAAGMIWAIAADEDALHDIVRKYGYKHGRYAIAS